MKKAVLALLIVIGLTALLLPRKKVLISGFSSDVHGAKATYTFRILNRTDRPLEVVVALAAEDKSESRSGTKLQPMGYSQVKITLVPKEEKTITGVLQLGRDGTSATAISYQAEIEQPNSNSEGRVTQQPSHNPG